MSLNEIIHFVNSGPLVQITAAIVGIASIIFAAWTHIRLAKMVRRNHHAVEELKEKVDPWMADARRHYAEEKLREASGRPSYSR